MTKCVYLRKDYFDFIFSVVITGFSVILVIGQIAFLTIGLTIGIADWGIEGVLAVGFGAFGPLIAIATLTTLFAAWRYWAFDLDGVTNGNLFFKKKLRFQEIELIETKAIAIGSRPFIAVQENLCFYKGTKVVTIPLFCLSKEELKWLSQQATIAAKKQEV